MRRGLYEFEVRSMRGPDIAVTYRIVIFKIQMSIIACITKVTPTKDPLLTHFREPGFFWQSR